MECNGVIFLFPCLMTEQMYCRIKNTLSMEHQTTWATVLRAREYFVRAQSNVSIRVAL